MIMILFPAGSHKWKEDYVKIITGDEKMTFRKWIKKQNKGSNDLADKYKNMRELR